MPQMSPMNWIMLMFYFFIIYMMMLSILYFITQYHMPGPPNINKMNSFLLKWY